MIRERERQVLADVARFSRACRRRRALGGHRHRHYDYDCRHDYHCQYNGRRRRKPDGNIPVPTTKHAAVGDPAPTRRNAAAAAAAASAVAPAAVASRSSPLVAWTRFDRMVKTSCQV